MPIKKTDKAETTTKYEHKTYGESRVYVEDGMYTLSELQEFIDCFKKRDNALKHAIKITGGK